MSKKWCTDISCVVTVAGISLDNAPTESFFRALRSEGLYRQNLKILIKYRN